MEAEVVPSPRLTRQQFIDAYTHGDRNLQWQLAARGRFALPCSCGEPSCMGWQMASYDEVERFLSDALDAQK